MVLELRREGLIVAKMMGMCVWTLPWHFSLLQSIYVNGFMLIHVVQSGSSFFVLGTTCEVLLLKLIAHCPASAATGSL